jgi:hypothetical protein
MKTDFIAATPLNPSEVTTIPHIASMTTMKIHTEVLSPELSDVFCTARVNLQQATASSRANKSSIVYIK